MGNLLYLFWAPVSFAELIEGKTIHLTRRALQAPPTTTIERATAGPSGPVSSTEVSVREEKEKFQINSANLFFICFGVEDETERDRRDSTVSMDTSATTSNNSSQGKDLSYNLLFRAFVFKLKPCSRHQYKVQQDLLRKELPIRELGLVLQSNRK